MESWPYLALTLCLGASTALPTLAYAVICLTTIGLHFAPMRLRRIACDTVFLLATDDRPVLSQFGTFFGAIGGVAAGFAAALS